MAIALLRADLTLDAKNKGVRRIRESVAGAIEVDKTYIPGAAPTGSLPEAVNALLRPYLVEPGGASVRLVV